MKTIFGPVPSRRLGRSLGIDVIRPKTCTYDCVYCESGRTTDLTLEQECGVSVRQVLEELEHFFDLHPHGADVLTFSSAGEPTLYEDLGPLITAIKERFPALPLVVLTNGSLLWKREIRERLLLADRVVPSMDAGSESVFRRVNRPHPRLKLDHIVEGMGRFREQYSGSLHLEVLLVAGVNDHPEELEKISRLARQVGPDRVELNTVVRPPAHEKTRGLSVHQMEQAAAFFPRESTEIIGTFEGSFQMRRDENLEDRVLDLLARRPCTVLEMADSLGVNPLDLERVLSGLCRGAVLKRDVFNGKEFYCLSARP